MKTEQALINLMEEAGEVVQIASKCALFGMDNYHPDDPEKTPNRVLLAREIGNFEHMVTLLDREIPQEDIIAGINLKKKQLQRWQGD